MNEAVLKKILDKLALHFEFNYYTNPVKVTIDSTEEFISELRSSTEKKGLLLIENEVSPAQVREFEQKTSAPFLFFGSNDEAYFFVPKTVNKDKKAYKITDNELLEVKSIFGNIDKSNQKLQRAVKEKRIDLLFAALHSIISLSA